MKVKITSPVYVRPVKHIAVGTVVELVREINEQYVVIRHEGCNYIAQKSSLSYVVEVMERID